MRGLITIFGAVPDLRTGNARRNDRLEILTIASVASICGCRTCVDMACFAEDREALFREFLCPEHDLPSHDTFLRLRRSFDRAAGMSALHAVTALATGTRLVIGQKAVTAGSDEIVAGRALLELLSLNGTLITADAIHCRTETAATVLARGGDSLLARKSDRVALHADVTAFFADPPPGRAAWHETSDADHGRIERRRHAVTQSVDWLFSNHLSDRRYAGEPAMPGPATLATIANTIEREGKTITATRDDLSAARLTPERFPEAVEAHGAIEISPHEVLDTAFDQDRAGTRKNHGPQNLATLRKLALNVLKQARPDPSIRPNRNRAG